MFIPVPMPKTRKGLLKYLKVFTILCITGAIVAFGFWVSDVQKMKKQGELCFNTLPEEDLESGLFVSGTIDTAIDVYAETFETNELGQRISNNSDKMFYVIPIYDNDKLHCQYFIAFEGQSKQFDDMEKIVHQTWNDVTEWTEIQITNGKTYRLPDEIQQLYVDWAQNPDFYEGGSFIDWCAEMNLFNTDDREDILSKMVPYAIYQTDAVNSNLTGTILCVGLSISFFVLYMIVKKSKRPIKGFQDDMTAVREFRELRGMDDNL